MPSSQPAEVQRGLEQAFRLCTEALDILDACGAPAEIAPHLDRAIHEIRLAVAGASEPQAR